MKIRVAVKRVLVSVFVDVVVTGLGVMVLVFLAVALGIVKVVKGPTSVTSTDVVVCVSVMMGITENVAVSVGVYVLVTCLPTVR